MARIQNYFERRFRFLLASLRVQDTDHGLQTLRNAASLLREREKIPASLALARIHAELCRCVPPRTPMPTHFMCDAGLGGLARWLRAAGYDAAWQPEWDDAGIIRETRRRGATLITTDTLMMERGVLRDRIVPAIWVPPTVETEEQLALVFAEMGLELRVPRCMKCGGELKPVSKEAVAARIPPKTFRWRDQFFLCARCDQLFWLGTHWGKIQQRLKKLAPTELPELRRLRTDLGLKSQT
ncbi:MAG: Mut7-C RNAse domain-containing protein [Verrucomicrobiales bacterium]|nr:Mut7-C RNAse domain-containing protein [Verrucomicrobiales bacterium]